MTTACAAYRNFARTAKDAPSARAGCGKRLTRLPVALLGLVIAGWGVVSLAGGRAVRDLPDVGKSS